MLTLYERCATDENSSTKYPANMLYNLRSFAPHARLLASAQLLIFACLFAPKAHAQPYDTAPRTLSIMSWNVEWMYDDYTGDNRSQLAQEQSAPNAEVWRDKVAAVAEVIANSQADIIALQEIEGDQTLLAIAEQIKSTHQRSYRYAFIQGTDRFTEQDVGLLVRSGLVSYRRQEQSKAMFDSGMYYNLSKHLIGEFRWENVESPLTVMNVHFRATAEAEEFRVRQAKLARHWLEPNLARGEDVILLGDFNSEAPPGVVEGDIAAIAGESGKPQMVDLLARLENPQASTHLILDRQFDRIMVSQSLLEDGPGLDWSFASIRILTDEIIRGQRDGEEHWDKRLSEPTPELDVSDHFPVIATFELK